jgi:hypothetical protein
MGRYGTLVETVVPPSGQATGNSDTRQLAIEDSVDRKTKRQGGFWLRSLDP